MRVRMGERWPGARRMRRALVDDVAALYAELLAKDGRKR
jgi:hypothetical protein